MLTSSLDYEGRYVSVCPSTSVSFTCTATQISSLTWTALPLLDEDATAIVFSSDSTFFRIINNYFNLSLDSVENKMGYTADLTSTLHIEPEGINNGTIVSCIATSGSKTMIILQQGLFKPLYFI